VTVPRALDPNYVATLEARVERLQEDNDRYAQSLKRAIRVIKTYEAVSAQLHEELVEALKR
jgi:hypothetical protein